MSMTADDRLVSQVARELSGPEPSTHFGSTLLVGTVVASPVLIAAAVGQQPVPLALALYLAALVVVWFVGGVIGGALAMAPTDRLRRSDTETDPPSPPAPSQSIGSDGAY